MLLSTTAEMTSRFRDIEHDVEANFSHQERRFLSETTSDSGQALEAQRHSLVQAATAEMIRRDAHNAEKVSQLRSELQHYHAADNQFERFRGFLDLISRFEFEFRRGENYICERFEFLVCSKFNHTQCGRTCACAVACLSPHNSISNVVVSVTTCFFHEYF